MFRPIGNAIPVLAVLLALAGCAGAEPATTSAPTSTIPAATGLSGPYVGQRPPGTTAEVFAPGIVSDPSLFEYSGTFSPDGNEYYFNRISADLQHWLLFTRVVGGNGPLPNNSR